MFDPAWLVFIDEIVANTKKVWASACCPRGKRLIFVQAMREIDRNLL
jgi:hypothetical protein